MKLGNRKNFKYLIIGGDDRFVELANIYKRYRYDISLYGLELAGIKTIKHFESLDEAIDKCNIIIAPVPFAKDTTRLNVKYSKNDIEIDELFSKMTEDKILLAGAVNNYAKAVADKYKVNFIDYYNDESFQILNTIPTVEGTIAIMINETNFTLYDSNVLVLGYGRIGKILSDYLKAMGANVFVEARKESDLTWVQSKRMNAIPLEDLKENIDQMDIIVNTVPSLLLDSSMLDLVKPEVLLLDVAAKPGGIDFDYANSKGLKNIHALSIPGKVACKSAAQYIFDTINNILDKI